MKTRPFLVLVVLAFMALTSCSTSSGIDASNSAAESPRAFAEKFMAAEDKAWSAGDVADLKALEATDVVYHMPGLEVNGWKAHEDYILQGRPKIANLKQNWKYLTGEGNHFALAYDSTATLLADGKAPETNVSNNYLFIFHVKDARIAEVWVNGNATSVEAKPEKKAGKKK